MIEPKPLIVPIVKALPLEAELVPLPPPQPMASQAAAKAARTPRASRLE